VPAPPTADVLLAFGLAPDTEAELLGAGHIHRTWRVPGSATTPPMILQRVNDVVFRAPHEMMGNLARLEPLLVARGVPTLRWRPAAGGALLHRDAAGGLWRSYTYVEGEVRRTATSFADVEGISRAFGEFAAALADEDPADWVETIPSFHDFSAREREWRFAVLRDEANRFVRSQPEIERASRVLERVHELDELDAWRQMPARVVHNDAKAINVVQGPDGTRTVIDLDTTMPGPLLADVGALVRTMCRSADEDDDLAAGSLQTERFGLVIRGWLAGYGRDLHPLEAAALPIAGIVLTVENALRFLADHLDGDTYFQIDRPDHNRARFRAQIGHAQVLLDGIDDLRRVAANELARRG
jgi:N-acetylhexosamine 1-kinase